MSQITRRSFVKRVPLAAAGVITYSGFSHAMDINLFQQTDYVDVEIKYGKLRGIRERDVHIFKGVPYAGSLSGERRFRSPEPLKPWAGIREAIQLGHPAIQPPNQTYGINEPEPAEDCLVLNIWTPGMDGKKRPVMFYNHGGGFSKGSGGSVMQDGANLSRHFDVVVVQTNHRLGLMGYLYLDELGGEEYKGSGNMGMLDIVAGLKWVHENIESFGGDPDNVMIFGESGGGYKTSCLYTMPSAAPFFNKASIESGPGTQMIPVDAAAETTRLLLKELNISSANWRKLLEVPVEKLLEMQNTLPRLASRNAAEGGSSRVGSFSPVVDGYTLPNHPFNPVAPEISRDKPLMVGWNEDEYTFFGLTGGDIDSFKLDFQGLQERLQPQYGSDTKRMIDTYRQSRPEASATDIYVAIRSITMMGLGSIEIASKKAVQKGAPVYLYNFGYKSEVKVPGTDYPIGTPHAMDIQFKFYNVIPSDDESEQNVGMAGSRPERFDASRNMAEMWTTFARSGKPDAVGQPDWPAYNLSTRPTMKIDSACEVINDRYKLERELWESLGMLPAV